MTLLGRRHHSEGEKRSEASETIGRRVSVARQRHIGLADGARRSQLGKLGKDLLEGSKKERFYKYNGNIPLEVEEQYVRSKVENRPMVLDLIGYYTAVKIFFLYLISISSVITCVLSVGLTIYWYNVLQDRLNTGKYIAFGMDWVILGFAVVTPLSLSVNISFRRRERALIEIAKFRSFAFQLLLSHAVWDWEKDGGKANVPGINWLAHTDEVLSELISVGDELCRFLTLPTTSRSRHRMTKSGRREAARTAEVAYLLYDSLYTHRMTKLTLLSEKVKLAGLGASEASRVRQYERWMGDAIENLRMIKSYRTPQTLRSFTRIFATLLPPFFAPTFAQLGYTTNLGYGITLAVITSLCLNALVEGIDILEDPFVGFVTLDGIDVREEFQVLHYQQLVTVRNQIYPDAKKYEERDSFVLSEEVMDDIESQVPSSDINTSTVSPLDTSKQSAPKSPKSRRHRHRMVSFGDAHLLLGIDDITSRESGYQISGRNIKHPFFKTPSKASMDVNDRKATSPLPPLFRQQLKVVDDEQNEPKSMDVNAKEVEDEELSQNIQSNSDTLPRRKKSSPPPPPLPSLFLDPK